MTLRTAPLTPDLWPALEALFGASGACGGCWCQHWRLPEGEKWEDVKGAEARRRLEAGVRKGEVEGVLCFDGDEPVGWATFGPRPSFPRLDRSRTLACDDAERAWSLPCFFVKAGRRGQGVATTLLAAALDCLRERGAEVAEAYPVRPKTKGEAIPAAFAWTGTRSMFDAAGFVLVGNEGGGKERVRLPLAGPLEAPGGVKPAAKPPAAKTKAAAKKKPAAKTKPAAKKKPAARRSAR
jgi:GNAT superfamily N-acetyltransferase